MKSLAPKLCNQKLWRTLSLPLTTGIELGELSNSKHSSRSETSSKIPSRVSFTAFCADMESLLPSRTTGVFIWELLVRWLAVKYELVVGQLTLQWPVLPQAKQMSSRPFPKPLFDVWGRKLPKFPGEIEETDTRPDGGTGRLTAYKNWEMKHLLTVER